MLGLNWFSKNFSADWLYIERSTNVIERDLQQSVTGLAEGNSGCSY